MRGKIISVTKYRKEILKDIIDYVKSMKEPVDVIIGGDYNQDIALTEVQQFFTELQLKDLHQTFNGIEVKYMDHTHSRGTKCIDSIAATPNIRKHIEGSKLFETNEIINTDH